MAQKKGRLPNPTVAPRQVATGRVSIGYVDRSNPDIRKHRPVSVDYFIFTCENMPDVISAIHNSYGDKPKSILVCFPSNSVSINCPQEIHYHDNSGKMVGWFDGVEYYRYSPAGKGYVPSKKEIVPPEYFRCFEVLTLNFHILGLDMPSPILFKLRTGGKFNSIPQIVANYDRFAEQLEGRGYGIANFPVRLSVKFHKSNAPGSQNRYPVLSFDPDFSEPAILAAQKFSQFLAPRGTAEFLTIQPPARSELTLAAPEPEPVPTLTAVTTPPTENKAWEKVNKHLDALESGDLSRIDKILAARNYFCQSGDVDSVCELDTAMLAIGYECDGKSYYQVSEIE
jgi:hypothetical protein